MPMDATEKPEGIFKSQFPNSTKQIEERNASGTFAFDLFSVTFWGCFVLEISVLE